MGIKKSEAKGLGKREAKWRGDWEQKAAKAVLGNPAQVVITIEGGMGAPITGPVTTTSQRFDHAVAWFARHGYKLSSHQQGMGVQAWTCIFERPDQ